MTEWNGFERLDFEFKGRKAIVIFSKKPNTERNWLLKTEYFDAFPSLEIEMVNRGWHLAYIENKHRWCCDEDLILKKEFFDFLTEKYKLYKKMIPVGMSCGGMFAVKYAALFPETVSCLYLDAPVMNLLSCPADLGAAHGGMYDEFVSATGMSMSELICFREHPIDKLSLLGNSKIPVVMVYGKKDDIVPYEENGAILEKYYRTHNLPLETIGKDNCGHHPHGTENPKELADLIEKYKD